MRRGLNAIPEWLQNAEAFETELRASYALISRSDLAIAQISRTLKEQGLDDNTLIVQMSDNGVFNGAHALEGKWLMYEESIHVPLIIRDPRLPVSTRGRRQQMALNIDPAPTIPAMVGEPPPAGMQGTDLQPLLRDATAQGREDWYYEHVYAPEPGRRAIPKSEGVRTERWKHIEVHAVVLGRRQHPDLPPLQGRAQRAPLAADAGRVEAFSRMGWAGVIGTNGRQPTPS